MEDWHHSNSEKKKVYMDPLLKIVEICKFFPGVRALHNVSIEIHRGNVHAIVGENGAGKTTLMRILAGIYPKDNGSLHFEGKEVHYSNTKESQNDGIAIIHQELNLPVNISIAQNIYLGRLPRNKVGIINNKQLLIDAKQIMNLVGLDVPPNTIINKLSIAQQQLVEIAKALSINSKLIIMDEPTSALNQAETKNLFKIISNLKKQGVTIIYISHRLEEIFEISDCITIMRDGQVVATKPINEVTHESVVTMMTGKTLENYFGKDEFSDDIAKEKEAIMEVEEITSSNKKLKTASFTLYKGEILGIAGLLGSGRTELVKAIYRADRGSTGKIVLEGKPLKIKTPKQAVGKGIALLPEDRKAEGLLLDMNIMHNIAISSMGTISNMSFINNKKRELISKQMSAKLNVKATSIKQVVKYLSGGNQQKVVFAKWLATNAKVLMLDDPTRGVDVGAKYEMYGLIRELAASGRSAIPFPTACLGVFILRGFPSRTILPVEPRSAL
jgi:ribose transport system ATP-binding protein